MEEGSIMESNLDHKVVILSNNPETSALFGLMLLNRQISDVLIAPPSTESMELGKKTYEDYCAIKSGLGQLKDSPLIAKQLEAFDKHYTRFQDKYITPT